MSPSKPVAVLISDVHYTPATLELAHKSLCMALSKAETLRVPLVIAGDLLDTKDIIRGVCANSLIYTLSCATVPVFILVGNHDRLNEKGKDHALNFLSPYATIINCPTAVKKLDVHFLPYFSSGEELQKVLNILPKGSQIIIHQGVQTAYMGHYQQDKSSLPKEAFADFRVISGHYHRRQDIRCGRPRKGGVGMFSYIGNPYTLSYGEASDPEKGFQILHDDGLLEFVPTGLRKHVVVEYTWEGPIPQVTAHSDDLLWLKVTGPASEITNVPKYKWAQMLGLDHNNFKLDLIPFKKEKTIQTVENTPQDQLFDGLIDSTSDTTEEKGRMKSLWREVIEHA